MWTTLTFDPQVSFRDAVWPNDDDSSLAERVWGSNVHPDWQVQQLLADVLVYFIQKSYARFLEVGILSSNPIENECSVCTENVYQPAAIAEYL